MKRYALYAACAAVLALSSCAFVSPGPGLGRLADAERQQETVGRTVRSYDLPEFRSVEVNVGCNVKYEQSDVQSIEIKSSDRVLDNLDVRVGNNGRLVIGTVKKMTLAKDRIDISICSPVIERLVVNGAADFDCPGGIRGERFDMEVNGSGDLDICGLNVKTGSICINGAADLDIEGVDCGTLSVEINGAGDCSLEGRTDKASVEINGAGNIDVRELDCPDLAAKVHGAGRVKRGK